MKTAEELFKEMYAAIREQLTLQEICVRCMEAYGKQCTEEALERAKKSETAA